jgi:hypothetical protein
VHAGYDKLVSYLSGELCVHVGRCPLRSRRPGRVCACVISHRMAGRGCVWTPRAICIVAYVGMEVMACDRAKCMLHMTG